jgi:hypothetical protein
MKYISFLFCIVSFIGCAQPKMEETFPFSVADKIEVISYPIRYEWDTIRNGKETHLGPLVENKKLINSSGIKERVFLNEKLRSKLFNSLFTDDDPECTVAMCFDPRHAILFYNNKSEIIATMEICFECGGSRAAFKHNELCYEGLAPIGKIFEEAGIKYFGEGEH